MDSLIAIHFLPEARSVAAQLLFSHGKPSCDYFIIMHKGLNSKKTPFLYAIRMIKWFVSRFLSVSSDEIPFDPLFELHKDAVNRCERFSDVIQSL